MRRALYVPAVRRWRHTHGFGVHSPGAFALLNQVVRVKEPYYGYFDVDAALVGYPHVKGLKSDCRLLIRLIGRLEPVHVTILSEHFKPLAAAAAAGDSRIEATACLRERKGRHLIYASRALAAEEQEILRRELSKPGTVLFARGWDQKVREIAEKCVIGGIIFAGKHVELICTRSGMPPMRYCVSL